MDELIHDNCGENCQIVLNDLSRKLYYNIEQFVNLFKKFENNEKIVQNTKEEFPMESFLINALSLMENNVEIPDSFFKGYISLLRNETSSRLLVELTECYYVIVILLRKINIILKNAHQGSELKQHDVTLRTLKHIFNKNKNTIGSLENELNIINRELYEKKYKTRSKGKNSLILKYFLYFLVMVLLIVVILHGI